MGCRGQIYYHEHTEREQQAARQNVPDCGGVSSRAAVRRYPATRSG